MVILPILYRLLVHHSRPEPMLGTPPLSYDLFDSFFYTLHLICLFVYFTPVILLLQVVSNISQDLAWYLDMVGYLDSDFEIPPGGRDG